MSECAHGCIFRCLMLDNLIEIVGQFVASLSFWWFFWQNQVTDKFNVRKKVKYDKIWKSIVKFMGQNDCWTTLYSRKEFWCSSLTQPTNGKPFTLHSPTSYSTSYIFTSLGPFRCNFSNLHISNQNLDNRIFNEKTFLCIIQYQRIDWCVQLIWQDAKQKLFFGLMTTINWTNWPCHII